MTPSQEYRTIPLTQGQVAIVDASDYEWISQWKWYARWDDRGKRFYASRCVHNSETGRQRMLHMHRELLGLNPHDKRVGDHIDRDGLNNRRSNLRICGDAQNNQNRLKYANNTSGFKGVGRNNKGWRARINVNGKSVVLGTFPTPEEAHEAYKRAAQEHHGEFANFG